MSDFLIRALALVFFLAIVSFFGLFLFIEIHGRVSRASAKKKKLLYLEIFSNKSRRDVARLCGMPEGVYLDRDEFPHDGEPYNPKSHYYFYIPHTEDAPAFVYHRTPFCFCGGKGKMDPVHVLHLGHRSPCPECKPKLPDLSWYHEYRRVMHVLKEHDVHIF